MEKFHFLIRLSYDLKYISPKAYENCAKSINEIGKEVGGWLKSINK